MPVQQGTEKRSPAARPWVPEIVAPRSVRAQSHHHVQAPRPELHLAVRPVLLGSGEHLWRDLDMHALGYECVKVVAGERATHVFLRKNA